MKHRIILFLLKKSIMNVTLYTLTNNTFDQMYYYITHYLLHLLTDVDCLVASGGWRIHHSIMTIFVY